ncbi:hypothetical protein AB833_00490 [Chromatiales bacterium (ex Bugula neritina AB1)]|nr:hypothetical protein AB833_00490 [Chromatiales bacterium (ex Bugula neritina AB1)]
MLRLVVCNAEKSLMKIIFFIHNVKAPPKSLSTIITAVRQSAGIPQENESTISNERITIESLRNFIRNNYSGVSFPALDTMPSDTFIDRFSRWVELEEVHTNHSRFAFHKARKTGNGMRIASRFLSQGT